MKRYQLRYTIIGTISVPADAYEHIAQVVDAKTAAIFEQSMLESGASCAFDVISNDTEFTTTVDAVGETDE